MHARTIRNFKKFLGSYEIKKLKPNTNQLFLNHIDAP